jgi:hypothetical protein
MEFYVYETHGYQAAHRPIVIITSNARSCRTLCRCFFHQF